MDPNFTRAWSLLLGGMLATALLLLLAAVLFGLLLHRQQRRVAALRRSHADELAARLREQAETLRVAHEAACRTGREQVLAAERQRLMQDMHDGLGSALLSALVAVEQGTLGQHELVELLRECVDDLRLVIDSVEPVGHDLVALLATMRFRLGKRLQAGGLQLDWSVHDIPPLEWLAPPDALQVLRLLQEAFNNVLKHAQASRVRLVTRQVGRWVEIRVEDDGRGFDAQRAAGGRGLRGLQRRADALHGHLRLDTSPGAGTRLSLRLPIVRRAAS
ncbi:MAG: hypothetical protein JO224_05260 [Pelomonas sp.]|nr:hypothetical protein [Roseateles sp.]